MHETNNPEDYTLTDEQKKAAGVDSESQILDRLNHLSDILELLLINQLRQTDLQVAVLLNASQEEIQRLLEAHSKGHLVGDLPYMSQ